MHRSRFLMVLSAVAALATNTYATPYAANVRNTGGSNWEFVLNEAADNVTILRNGGNALNLGAQAVGRHTFDMTGFTTFDIKVSKSAATAWTDISSSANLFTNFEQPSDVIVNTNAASPYFGTIYVNNDRALATASGRQMGDGIYALTADRIGVNLASNFAVVADPNDTTQAKAPHWTVTGTGSDVSAWKITLDQAGNLIASDWSDQHGGIKYATPDLAHGGPLLKHEDGLTPLLGNSDDGTTGPGVHGSIVSRPYVTGSVGNNLVVYAMDEDNPVAANSGNHVWRWNVGNVTNVDPPQNPTPPFGKAEFAGGYDQPPQLVVNVSNLQKTSDLRSNFLALNVGVQADAVYSPQYNKWYLTQNRDNGDESGIVVVTPDGVDGNTPTVAWSSLQFSIDNGLDGKTGFPATPTGNTLDQQDVFRNIRGDVMLSPDGKYLMIHRGAVQTDNPVLGTTSNNPGAVLFIPLDANGVPNMTVAAGQITNLKSITTASNNNSHGRAGLAMDAAGNVYTTNNVSELLQVWSPGGNWVATTKSDGTFSLVPLAAGVAGDYNGNGVVDAADYVLWRNGGPLQNEVPGVTPGSVTPEDYDAWRARFGNNSGSGSGDAVPEPATVALLALGLISTCGYRKRRESARLHV
jgi:hypothetical protein